MNQTSTKLGFLGFLIPFLLCPCALLGHEPIYGLGPDMPPRGLFGYELEWESAWGGEREDEVHQEILYGITSDFAVTVSLPYLRAEEEGGKRSEGFGDLWLRVKYRFLRRDFPGGSDQVAAILGIKAPTGDVGSNSWDGLTAVTGTHSIGHWYLWGDLRYLFNGTANDFKSGNELDYDLAVGWRPYIAEYDQVDINPVLEFNGITQGRDKESETLQSDSGGSLLFMSPGLLLSYRRIMFKVGFQVPIVESLNGTQEARNLKSVAALEIHF